MSIWFAFLIPVLVLFGSMLILGRKMNWWEPILLCALSFGISAIGTSASEASQTRANEFIGGWVTSAEKYEPWNEWISQTCTRCISRDTSGRCTQEETYDCSYCNEHSESHEYETTIGSGFFNSEEVWNYASVKFGKQYVNLNRHSECSSPRNGNKWVAEWDGDSAKMLPYFKKQSYVNRVQAAPTLFSFRKIDPLKTKVYKYPSGEGVEQNSILSDTPLPNQTRASDLLNYYNGKYGATKECHAYLIVFKNSTPEAGRDQEAFWKGGGKNELVTTVGIDDSGNITWAYVFSWSKEQMPNIVIRDSLMRMKKFDAYKVVELIGQEGVKKFTRRHFREFEYITVQPSSGAIITVYVVVTLMSIGWIIFMVMHGSDISNFDIFSSRGSRNRGRRYNW